MKKSFYVLRWIVAVIALTFLVVSPATLFAGAGVIYATNFITSTITWAGKENLDYFLRPMFIGKSPWETKGIRVIPNVQSTLKLNYFGIAGKILKAYQKGFQPSTGTVYTQRDLTVVRMEAEIAEDANDFYQTVYEQALNKGEWDDLSGTVIYDIVVNVFKNAVLADIYRVFWLGDTAKETLTAAGNYSGTPDTTYNAFDGMWKLIMANASTTPTDWQIKRVAVTDSGVAQVATVTANGGGTTTSTLTITFGGVNYSQVYITSYTQTCTNFAATHAAALALRGVTLTASGATTIWTSAIPGQPFLNPVIASASTVTGSVAATTANTPPSAFAAGESEDTLAALYSAADPVLKQVPNNQKLFLVDQLVYDNYQTYLESFTADGGLRIMLDGFEFITYRGIPVIPMNWGLYLDADFAHGSTYLPGYSHRGIYTTVDNLVMGIDSMSEYNMTEIWYNKDEQENRFRTQLKIGANYVHNKLLCVAY